MNMNGLRFAAAWVIAVVGLELVQHQTGWLGQFIGGLLVYAALWRAYTARHRDCERRP